MPSSRRNIQSLVSVILDTSTLFSAIRYPLGNEAKVFFLAESDLCSIYLLDYVLEELREVFLRKGVEPNLINEFLETYNNIQYYKLEKISETEAQYVKQIIDDVEDRPIFLFVKRTIDMEPDTYFISGDKGFFKEKVVKELNGRILRTTDFLRLFVDE